MAQQLTRADREHIRREIKEAPKPQLPERTVRLSCGHEVTHRVAEGETGWYEKVAVCEACRTKQMFKRLSAMIDQETGLPMVPHEFVGGADCCGCLVVEVRGDEADLVCNECLHVVKTVDRADVVPTLTAMLLWQPENYEHNCPHCGALNVFPGFSSMFAYICSRCGQGVTVK
jgi:hypothetical protein